MYSKILTIPLAALLASSVVTGQTVTVTTSSDAVDINPTTGTVATLPGPDGVVSFSEALIATNNTPGQQTIEFALTGSTLLSSIVGTYWRATDTVTIDATTQPGGVQLWRWGLSVNAPDCTVMGFHQTAIGFSASGSLALANTGGSNITLAGSGGHRAEGNDAGTIKIDGGSSNNVVVGNTVKQVSVNGGSNNVIGGPNLADRNFITGFGSLSISQGLPSGTTVGVGNTTGTVIENNYIGTTPDGLSKGNVYSTIGIGVVAFNDNLIIRDNLIAGIKATGIGQYAGVNFGWAVLLWGTSGGTNIEISGNTVGLDANGDPLLGSVWGIDVGHVLFTGTYTDVRIFDNVVAGHSLNGITVGPQIPSARIQRNSVHGNGWLGIDLIQPANPPTGVTPNDPLDLDTGGNGLQNFPELQSATLAGAGVRVIGTLHSTPLSDFTIELFASPECDSSGFGEGELFLGSTSVTTDAAGDASFDVVLAVSAPSGWFVTATATAEPLGATSEFSACMPIAGVCQPDLGFQGPGSVAATLCGFGLGEGESSDYVVSGAESGAAGAFLVSQPNLANVTLFPASSSPGTLVSGTGLVAAFPIVADASGDLTFPVPGEATVSDLVFQSLFVDSRVPEHNLAFTNAVLARFGH